MLVDGLLSLAPSDRQRAPAPALRRPAAPPSGDDLPPELAFLLAQGVGPPILRRAARIAERTGVTGEAALFGLGYPDERYGRLLARHLGAPYLTRPLPLAREGVDLAAALAVGWAPLAPNRNNVGHAFAPRGAALRLLLDEHRFDDRGTYGFAVTTRRRFEALLRRHDEAAFAERAACGLADWDAALSARGGATRGQKAALLAGLALSGLGAAALPTLAGVCASAALLALFGGAVALRLLAVAAGRAGVPPAGPPTPDADLPVYTVIVPLFREARMLPALLRAIDALDYPAAKLDVKIALECGDSATMAAAARLGLPPRYDVLVLPDGHPRTKPRALNAALESARGDLVVVYDAEDRPEPGQLRAAAARFGAAPRAVACLQARLTVDHADETWLTRLFALDYAALFHAVMPGLAAHGFPVALGGTSNHFRIDALRRVGGWDAWNVTEDIDLGYRLARFGYRVEALDSDTFEEAPLTLERWMPQRSRWLKGWMVTLIVHGRDPARLFRDLGWRGGLSVAVSLSATVLSCLLGLPFLAAVGAAAWMGRLFRPDTPLWWLFVACSAALFCGGVTATLWPALLGLRRMGRPDLAPWLALLPLHLLLVSAAAWRALFELLRDPQAWNKTEHGLARGRVLPSREGRAPMAAARPGG